MAKVIEILNQRVNTTDEINSWLFTTIQSIIKQSTNHLKGVERVMPEFDLHDSSHSASVLEVIEMLLGDTAENLSSFELFYIIASSYLHDCGMAISDFEKNIMKLTEGTDDIYLCKDSLKNDGKRCFTYEEAKRFIIQNKNKIYVDFNGEIQNWLFVPPTEDDLVQYLSDLLIEYQNFRNKNYITIKKSTDFAATNQSLRTEYIRLSHHKRIFEYIKNWGKTRFSTFPINGIGQRIANDLAVICKAHGENPEYLSKLGTQIEYCGHDSINLQFIAMLLRIGDIVHFNSERAPLELRALRQFSSSFSFEQWRVKATGINYDISNGTIAFRAYITRPADYYVLQHYIDWIDNELHLFLQLSAQWDSKHRLSIREKVERSNIAYDDSIFTPVLGLKFTLNQKRILDLLMGVGLYKDKFACIRELYQNSLDACRFQVAKDKIFGKQSKGIIEFGIGEDNGDKYLYCLDNGKGMSASIIENYLLKIGNSYYQSPDFYQSQAETGFVYTPTSQFGIGILSCFIIGDRIEIVTKEDNGNYIACSIDGPSEFFYYKKTSKLDEDLIKTSGTIVKVFLKKEYYDSINTIEIGNLGLVSYIDDGFVQQLRPDLNIDYNNWKNSLLKIISNYIIIVPEQIELFIKWNNNQKQRILSKPYIHNLNKLQITDIDVIDQYLHRFGNACEFELKDYINLVDCHVLMVEYNGLSFKTIMKFPRPGMEQYGYEVMKNIPIDYSYGICVDGISADGHFEIYSFTERLIRHGIVNFYGDNRPQLSVDRKDLVDKDNRQFEIISKEIIRKIIGEAISKAHHHIQKYNIQRGSELYNMVWKSVFHNFSYASSILFEVLSQNIYNVIEWDNLSTFLENNITVGGFINQDIVQVPYYDYHKLNSISQILLLNKLCTAREIQVNENNVSIISHKLTEETDLNQELEDSAVVHTYLVRTNNYGKTFDEYDIISNLYPIVPDHVYNLISNYDEMPSGHLKKIHSYSNGITAFYEQSPLEIDEELGLYLEEREIFRKKAQHIRSLRRKRNAIFPNMRVPNDENLESDKYILALTAYIAPRELLDNEKEELANYKDSNPSYYKGVTEGWSIIVTGESDDKMNTYIKSGKHTRKDLVNLIPHSFWEKYSDHIHIFPNGIQLKKLLEKNT